MLGRHSVTDGNPLFPSCEGALKLGCLNGNLHVLMTVEGHSLTQIV